MLVRGWTYGMAVRDGPMVCQLGDGTKVCQLGDGPIVC